MSKNKKSENSGYVYFKDTEETVIRKDETQKEAITKIIKRKKAKKAFLNTLSIVLIVAIVVSSFFLGKRGIEKFLVLKQEEEQHNQSKIPDDVMSELENMSEEEKWAYLYQMYPELINVNFPTGILCDYALYYANNPETVGYVKIEGTKIDTPVVQADNNFDPFDRNTLLYGHNMNDGSRFAALLNYKSLDFFKKHPTIQFDSLFEKNTWKIYAVVITNGSTESDNGYFFDFTFNHCSDACYEEYIAEIEKRKLYETGVDLLPTDTIVTLCTCTYEYDDARLLVIARKLRPGESPEVDTSLASMKSTPVKYPDSYYADPSQNPYKNDKKFFLY